MSGTHKYPTISFHISPREREEVEAKIFASGMKKKDYFVRSCIYNHVCVVGKKETVYQIVEKLQEMQRRMKELCKERNNLYEKQNDLKGQKWKIEKSLEQ